MRPRYYSRDGQPITQAQWLQSFFEVDNSVALTGVGVFEVSTVFLGLNHNWSDHGPPLIFETMVFPTDDGDHDDLPMARYPTEAAALAGHDQIVAAMRDRVRGTAPSDHRADP